jgi:hypothetical protein
MRLVLVAILLCGGCAMQERPMVIWFKPVPEGWTPPPKFAHCTINSMQGGQYVMENGKPKGLPTIRLDCVQDEETVYLERDSKRVVWREHWWGSR